MRKTKYDKYRGEKTKYNKDRGEKALWITTLEKMRTPECIHTSRSISAKQESDEPPEIAKAYAIVQPCAMGFA